MKARDFFRYSAKPFNIFILLSVLIFIILFSEIMLIQIAVSYTKQEQPKQKGLQWDIERAGKCFTPDGRLLLTEDENKIRKIYDANYTLLWEGKKKDLPKEYETISWPKHFQTIRQREFIQRQRLTPDMSSYLEIPIRQDKKIKEIWRYLPDKNIFEGFEYKGKNLGFISIDGFNQSPADNSEFSKFPQLAFYVPKESRNPLVLWQTKHYLYAVDIENRKSETLLNSKDELKSLSYKNWMYDNSPVDANYRSFVYYTTKDGNIYFTLNETGEQIIITPPTNWDNYLRSFVTVTAAKDAIFLLHSTSDILKPQGYDTSYKIRDKFDETRPFNKALNYSYQLYKVDNSGSLELIKEFKWVKPAYINVNDWFEYYFSKVTIFSPPIFHTAVKIMKNLPKDIDQIFPRDEEGMMRNYMGMIKQFAPQNIIMYGILSFVMMLITLWHGWARKNKFTLVLWALFVGLFNVAGLLTYLALNHTPIIKCAVCGRKRNLEKDECIRCGAKLPAVNGLVIAD